MYHCCPVNVGVIDDTLLLQTDLPGVTVCSVGACPVFAAHRTRDELSIH